MGNYDTSESDDLEDKEWDEDYYPIPIEYASLFDQLVIFVDELLKRPSLSPKYITYAGYLKFVLSRIPLVTHGIEVEMHIFSEDSNGSRSGKFLRLSDTSLEVSNVDLVLGNYGSDSHVNTIFKCESHGYIDDGGNPIAAFSELDNWVGDLLKIASDIEWKLDIKCILDEFDWEGQLEDKEAWQKMPSYYI